MAEQNEEKQKKGKPKRIVSKQQYARIVATRVLMMLALGSAWFGGRFLPHYLHLLGDLLFISGYICYFYVMLNRRKFHALDSVRPITRHNTGQLPAEESLVRAASVPPMAQEAVLLRPTIVSVETPKEQLLRAGVPQSED